MLLNFGLGTPCKYHLEQVPNGQLCQKYLNQKVNYWSNLILNEIGQKMPF
jgi:hypothetical protein